MHVFHVISSLDPKLGGPTAALAGLAEAQVRVGLKVSVAATYADGQDLSAVDALRQRGVEVHTVGPCTGALSRHPDLHSAVERLIAGADVVHVHAIWEEIQHQASRISVRLKKPYVIRACGMLDPWSLAQSKLKKWLYMAWRLRRNLNHAAAIHVSTGLEGEMVGRLGLTAPNIIEPNGISLADFQAPPPPGTFRGRIPQLAGRRYVAYLGRIHPLKGLELLIPALSKVADRSIALVIIGPDSENFKAIVERSIKDAGVADRVIFAGELRGPDKVAALADADLLALPSYHENFGVAVIESLAAGVPVVVSDHVYIHREISAAGVGGVCALDVDSVARELNRWLTDNALRASAARRARAFVGERYDWLKIAGRWEDHYRSLSGPAPSSAGNLPARKD